MQVSQRFFSKIVVFHADFSETEEALFRTLLFRVQACSHVFTGIEVNVEMCRTLPFSPFRVSYSVT